MEEQKLLERLAPFVGGAANISRSARRGGTFYLMLKDTGMADLQALRAQEEVAEAELERGRLRLTLQGGLLQEEYSMADNKQIAKDVLAAVGGKENVTGVTHCMTRLRFNLKDETLAKDEVINAIPGVAGIMHSGGQTQIIIGQNVDKVYGELCAISGLGGEVSAAPAEKKALTPAAIGGAIMDYLSGSLTPIIPVVLAASIFKMLVAVFGPGMLGVLAEGSDLYTLFTFVGDAGFYFFPLLVGYTAAKKLGVTPVMGIFMGAIMLHPTMVQMAADGTPFTVYGLPCTVQNYASTLLPILLSVWVMGYVERFFKKIIPDSLKIMFVPTLTVAVMLPVALCVLGPLGGFLGTYICGAIIWFGNTFGFLGAGVIGAAWEFLVMTGMHHVMIAQMILVFSEVGYDPVVTLGACSASLAVTGMCLGMFLALRDKEQKGLSLSYTIAAILGGVTEPGLYGVGMRYTKPFIGMAAGGFAGGLYAGLMGVKAYAMVPVASFLALTGYAGGSTMNLVHGIISGIISVVVAAVVTYLLCREKKSDGK